MSVMKNTVKISDFDYDNECTEIIGEVTSLDESTYSKTHVSGGSVSGRYNDRVTINSSTSTHDKMVFWLKTEDGREERIDFTDSGIEVRETHIVKVVYSKKTGDMLRLKNMTTGSFWKINLEATKRTFGDIFAMFFASLICALPIINFYTIYLFSGHISKEANFSNELKIVKPNVRFFLGALISGIVMFLLPFAVNVRYPNYFTSEMILGVIVVLILLPILLMFRGWIFSLFITSLLVASAFFTDLMGITNINFIGVLHRISFEFYPVVLYVSYALLSLSAFFVFNKLLGIKVLRARQLDEMMRDGSASV
jgi:hypothetical protein